MKQLNQRFSSIYSEDEERVLGPWQRIRQYVLTPIAAILVRLGIKPDMLSYTSVAFGIGFTAIQRQAELILFGQIIFYFLVIHGLWEQIQSE